MSAFWLGLVIGVVVTVVLEALVLIAIFVKSAGDDWEPKDEPIRHRSATKPARVPPPGGSGVTKPDPHRGGRGIGW